MGGSRAVRAGYLGESPVCCNEVFDVLEMVVVSDEGCADGKGSGGDPDVIEGNHGSGVLEFGAYLSINHVDVLRRLNDAADLVERFVTGGADFGF